MPQRESLEDRPELGVSVRLDPFETHEPTSPEAHVGIEIHLVLRGRGQYFVNGLIHSLQRNSVLLIGDKEIHSFVPDSSTAFKQFCILFPRRLLKNRVHVFEILKDIESIRHLSLSDEDAHQAEYILHTVLQELHDMRQYWIESIANHVDIFLTLLHRAGHEGTTVADNTSPVVSRVVEFADAHFADRLTLDDVAAHVNISKYHLSRVFKNLTGMGFKEYLIRRRIMEAKLLLESTDMNVSTIALQVGFEDISNFYRRFKQYTGMSAETYRKKVH